MIRIDLLCIAVGAFSLRATAQQSDTPGTPAATGFKAKFKEKRAKLVGRMKNIYSLRAARFSTAKRVLAWSMRKPRVYSSGRRPIPKSTISKRKPSRMVLRAHQPRKLRSSADNARRRNS